VEDVNRISDETSRGMNEAEQAVRNLAELSSRLAALIEEMRQG
jgi:methyl-accepting chemotaxis protein